MKRILIAEDQVDIANFLKRGLEKAGFGVEICENGALALEILENCHAGNEIHLVISDIQMPVMDGIALALNLVRDMPHIPIILMTGYAEHAQRAIGLKNLVYEIIEKPFEFSLMLSIIQSALKCK